MSARIARRARRAVVVLAAGLVVLLAGPLGATGLLPPANPSLNVRPAPDFFSSGSCTSVGTVLSCANPCVDEVITNGVVHLVFHPLDNTAACTTYILRAINAARRVEGVGPMVLPNNWFALTTPEQLFVLADLERVDRGLPPYLGLNRALSAAAQRAALAKTDPAPAPGFRASRARGGSAMYGGAWSSGFSTLVADYVWMYEDGWSPTGSPNQACTSAGRPGCWAHRDELLGFAPGYNTGVGLHCRVCEMGAGFAATPGSGSFTDLVERPAGRAPAVYFSWARDVVPYLAH